MRRRNFLLLLGLFAFAGLTIGGWLIAKPLWKQAEVSGLEFETNDLTTPILPEATSHEQPLRVTNRAKHAVTLHRFETSCNCLGVEPNVETVFQPGETKSFVAKFRAELKEGERPDAEGITKSQVAISVISTALDPKRPIRTECDLIARVRPAFQLNPGELRLGTISNRTDAIKIETEVKRFGDRKSVRVLPHPEWNIELTRKSETVDRLVLTAIHPGAPRTIQDGIAIFPVGSEGKEGPSKGLKIVGEIAADIQAVPKVIHAGRVKIGAELEETIRFESLTKRKFEVVRLAGPDVKVVPNLDESYTVKWVAKGVGESEVLLSIELKQDDGSTVIVMVPMRSFGNKGEK